MRGGGRDRGGAEMVSPLDILGAPVRVGDASNRVSEE